MFFIRLKYDAKSHGNITQNMLFLCVQGSDQRRRYGRRYTFFFMQPQNTLNLFTIVLTPRTSTKIANWFFFFFICRLAPVQHFEIINSVIFSIRSLEHGQNFAILLGRILYDITADIRKQCDLVSGVKRCMCVLWGGCGVARLRRQKFII